MTKVIHQRNVLSNSKNTKIILLGFMIILFSFSIFSYTYADDVDYSVVVEPVLNITTSGDTDGVVSLDLNPETKAFDSKNLTVTVGTNNETGYKLYVNTTGDTTNLVEKNDSNLYIQTLADNGTTGYTENTFTANRWGYKLNTQNYFPFVSGALINSSDTATAGVSSTLTFGAKANYDTKAGSYALALNFQATANPQIYYIQDFTNEMCSTQAVDNAVTVIDKRDNQEYAVRYINGNCWMVSNLRFVGSSIDPTATNINTAKTLTYYQIGNDCPDDGYSNILCIKTGVDDSNNPTVWYNYPAASAGTIFGTYNTNVATYSLCPAGWRMPTYSEATPIFNGSSTYISVFSPTGGGLYNGGSFEYPTRGYWWTATAVTNDSRIRYLLRYYDSAPLLDVTDNTTRYTTTGRYIRCIRSN